MTLQRDEKDSVKLSTMDVKTIKYLYEKEEVSITNLSELFDVSRDTVYYNLFPGYRKKRIRLKAAQVLAKRKTEQK